MRRQCVGQILMVLCPAPSGMTGIRAGLGALCGLHQNFVHVVRLHNELGAHRAPARERRGA